MHLSYLTMENYFVHLFFQMIAMIKIIFSPVEDFYPAETQVVNDFFNTYFQVNVEVE